ncbi:MAG: hydantoinase/oxoprolinase family protein [archaeon]|nr:hydantoinase/oxoprolinase family protein [archaeon]
MAIGLGIDTGGTYTDAVILDMDDGTVYGRSKARTTREDLSIGIDNAIRALDATFLEKVSLVSLSSTLATNAVVEGKGGRIGLICIGKRYEGPEEPEAYVYIGSKFSMSGKEEVPLDMDEVDSSIKCFEGKVDAVTVSGYLSVRYPAHEKTVSDRVKDILNVPVVCARDLTSKLGFEQRTTTAIMNARLLPIIDDLLESVKTSLRNQRITAPLMVVKGDGSVISENVARERPIETVLSGPASSLTGAKTLTGLDNAVMMDIGGTTTDIGILRNGFPRTDVEGALIDGRRTRVLAADISTYGIGGDSRIIVNGKDTVISPVRIIPLCVAATKWPNILERLKELEDVTDDRSADICPIQEIVQDTEFFTPAHTKVKEELNDTDRRFLELIKERPLSLHEASEALEVPYYSISATKMESEGFITRIGVTPTDVLHANGEYTDYSTEASGLAIGYLSRKAGVPFDGYLSQLKGLITDTICRSLMTDILLEDSGKDSLDQMEQAMVSKVLDHSEKDYRFGFRLNLPIIGIGAPVGSWLPAVAERFGTELVLPDNWDVGNAIGAITGSVVEHESIEIRAADDRYLDDPECIVFSRTGPVHFPDIAEAMAFAENEVRTAVLERSRLSNAKEPMVTIDTKTELAELSADKKVFRTAVITATAVGKPDFLK